MKIENVYPEIRNRRFLIRDIRKMTAYLFFTAFFICVIINLSVSGEAWSIIVGIALWILWRNLIKNNLIENTFVNRITQGVLHICILLFTINIVYGLDFAAFVVMIIFFGLLVLLGTILFSNFKKQKRNLMPLTWLICVTAILFTGSALGFFSMNWPMIALGSVAIGLIVVSLIWFRKDILNEWKKRFH